MQEDQEREPVRPGIFDSAKSLLATLVGIVYTRIELFSTELREEVDRAASLLLRALLALFLLGLGFLLAAVAVIIAFWDSYRLLAAILLAAGSLGVGGVLWFSLRASVRERPRPLDATLTELAKDERELRGRS
ncbi:MAG: phage holin family protein [Burkholderiales bacterium]